MGDAVPRGSWVVTNSRGYGFGHLTPGVPFGFPRSSIRCLVRWRGAWSGAGFVARHRDGVYGFAGGVSNPRAWFGSRPRGFANSWPMVLFDPLP